MKVISNINQQLTSSSKKALVGWVGSHREPFMACKDIHRMAEESSDSMLDVQHNFLLQELLAISVTILHFRSLHYLHRLLILHSSKRILKFFHP